jgi:hypothetical protein
MAQSSAISGKAVQVTLMSVRVVPPLPAESVRKMVGHTDF